jgi:hypothetical protein
VEGTVELTWSVRFEPLPGARLPATWLTRGVIGRYLDALARRLAP